jgi:voltage-gated sodium channel
MFGKSDYHPHDKKKATQFGRLSIKCEAIANTNWFATTILLTIVAVGVVEICDTNEVGHPGAKMVCQYVFLAVFLAEAVVKLIGFGWNYWKDGWNRFDFVIVAISVFELIMMFAPGDGIGGLTFLRLLRLLRVMRMLNSLPALRSVTQSLMLAFSNVGWVMLMMLLINFVFAVIGCLLFAQNDPQHFGRLSSSVMSIWQVETFDAWEEIMYINMYGCKNYGYQDIHGMKHMRYAQSKPAPACSESQGLGWVAALYLVFVCVLGGLIMPTVLIGVISVAFEESTFRIKEEKKAERCETKVIATARTWGEEYVEETSLFHMQCVFDLINFEPSDDGIQTLEADELVPFLQFVSEKYLSPIEEKKLQMMFDIVDVSGDNEVSWAEFLWFVLFLKKNAHLVQEALHGDSSPYAPSDGVKSAPRDCFLHAGFFLWGRAARAPALFRLAHPRSV